MSEPSDKEMCSICSGDFKQPKTLKCNHSFCQNCLADHIDKTSSDGHFRCPQCQCDATLPEGGVKNLPSKSTSDVPRCAGMKVECSNSCEFKCLDCNNFLCGSCKELHDTFHIFRNHRIVAWNDPEADEDLCPCHRRKMVEFFCSTCKKQVCSKCYFNDHNGHNLKDLEEEGVRQQIKDELSSLNGQVKSQITKMKQFSESLETKKGEVKDLLQRVCDQIDDQVSKVCGEVTRIGENMKDDIKKTYELHEEENSSFDTKTLTNLMEETDKSMKLLEATSMKLSNILEVGSIGKMLKEIEQPRQDVEDCCSTTIPDLLVMSFEAGEIDVGILKKLVGKINSEKNKGVLEEYAITLKEHVQKIIRAFKLAYLPTHDEQED